jgi:hypothetical protein
MSAATSADVESRFRAGAKVCSGVIMVLLVIAALGPAKWAPRTELGWQFDHFIGYFGITLFFCVGWPPTVRGWGSLHGRRGTARGSPSIYTGSVSLSSGYILRRRRGASGGSNC